MCDKNEKRFEKAKWSQGQDTQRQFGGNKAFLAQKPNSKASTGERKNKKEDTCNFSKIPKAKQDKIKTLALLVRTRWVKADGSTSTVK